MSKFLLVFASDWADEFDCEKYAIYNSKEAAQSVVDEYVASGGYFGTNEGFEPRELAKGNFEITEITEAEYDVLRRLLGQTFGTGLA